MKFGFLGPAISEEKMFENVDWRGWGSGWERYRVSGTLNKGPYDLDLKQQKYLHLAIKLTIYTKYYTRDLKSF